MISRWPAVILCLVLASARVLAEPQVESWGAVFAPGRDSAVFLGADGTLFRAPFDLRAREILWRAGAGQHVVRFATSPVGRRVAWITRGFDGDTTRLWVWSGTAAEQRLRYFALRPEAQGQTHAEPDVPTTADDGARGARLVEPGPFLLRSSANTLAWTADGRNVLLGYDGGIAEIPAEPRAGSGETRVLAIGIEPLPATPLVLVDALVPQASEDRQAVSAYDLVHASEWGLDAEAGRKVDPMPRTATVLSPDSDGWTLRDASGWAGARARAAGERTLWWARQRFVYALGPGDAAPVQALRAASVIEWLGFDPAHGDLLIVTERELWRRPESGGAPALVLETSSPVRKVLACATSPSIGLLTRDSLLLWDPRDGTCRRVGTGRLEPAVFVEGPEGRIVVLARGDPGSPPVLARADPAAGRLVPIETPAVRGGAYQTVDNGAWIVFYAPGSRPCRELHAYDVREDRWRSVDNPGISAWELLR